MEGESSERENKIWEALKLPVKTRIKGYTFRKTSFEDFVNMNSGVKEV